MGVIEGSRNFDEYSRNLEHPYGSDDEDEDA